MSVRPPLRRAFSDAKPSKVFHLARDDDDDSADELPVPFPVSAPSEPPSPVLRPQLVRGASAPILLSNGKPLKSSLKSPPSSPSMTTYPPSHLRACSEPSTPKNVHFPEKDNALATVRVFRRSARPAALSNPTTGNGDETETEGEETPPLRFPFPSSLSSAFNYEIDPTKSCSISPKCSPSTIVILESLSLSSSSTSQTTKPLLTGAVLVRNLAFEKRVAIRFTLDDWQTVSEVSAHYANSMSLLPSNVLSLSPTEHARSRNSSGWDRFTFTIRLEDYAHSLSTRTLWLAARYSVSSTYPDSGSVQHGPGGEWWDNNGGTNYRIAFRPAMTVPKFSRIRPRSETVSAPMSSPRTKPQPAVTVKEHVLGHMVPSLPQNNVQSMNEPERRSIPLHAGKLSLCNYASPTVRRSANSPRNLSPPRTVKPDSPSSTPLHSSSDEDIASPASSVLSTPSASPTIAPRVLINGHPATSVCLHSIAEKDDALAPSRPVHLSDWDWSAPGKPRNDGPPRLSVSELSGRRYDVSSPQIRMALAEGGDSLYDVLVSQWCFAQGSSLMNHDVYDNGGIVA